MYRNKNAYRNRKTRTTKSVVTTFLFAVLDAKYYNLERRKKQTIYIYLNISVM